MSGRHFKFIIIINSTFNNQKWVKAAALTITLILTLKLLVNHLARLPIQNAGKIRKARSILLNLVRETSASLKTKMVNFQRKNIKYLQTQMQ